MPQPEPSDSEAITYYRDVIEGIGRYLRDGGSVVLNANVSDDAINITFSLPRGRAASYFLHLIPPSRGTDEQPGAA